MNNDPLGQEYALQRKTDFEGLSLHPAAWRYHAQLLRRGAEVLHHQHQYGWEQLPDNTKRLMEADPNSEEHERLVIENFELFEDLQLIETYILLMAYSIENLVKGIVLSKNPDFLNREEGKLTRINNHFLNTLVRDFAIYVTSEEVKLLDLLETYIMWEGKYPVPREEDKMYPFEKVKGSGVYVPRGQGIERSTMREQITPLRDRLALELLRLAPQRQNTSSIE